MRIPITSYPNHITLSTEITEKLFWKNYNFEIKKQFAQNKTHMTKNKIEIWTENKLHINIFSKNTNKTEIFLDQKTKNKFTKPDSVEFYDFIKTNQNTTYTQIKIWNTDPKIEISKSDADFLKLKNNQKVKIIIPYKKIEIENITIKVRDNFVLDFFCMRDFAKKNWIQDNDWCQIVNNFS